MGTATYTYSFNATGNFNGQLNLSLTATTPATNSTGFGLGYAVTSITGNVGATTITGEIGSGGATGFDNDTIKQYDNTVFTSDSAGDQGSVDGLDSYGLDFYSGSTHYAVYYNPNYSKFLLLYSTGSGPTGSSGLTLLSSNAPCYCPGTLILTSRGEQPIETLAINDIVVTASGQHRPIRWIGRRSYAGRFLAANPTIQPVRFSAGSLGNHRPRRDLLVSPEHAMFVDGLLVPAHYLINGTTISQDRGRAQVDYIHVELDSHDLLLAEGTPSESFLDDNSRGMFHNAAEYATLYPNVSGSGRFCAPRLTHGHDLDALRKRLADLARDTVEAA